MNKKILTIGIALLITHTVMHTDVYAEDIKEAGRTATFVTVQKSIDRRPEKLEKYLASKQSPLTKSARHFIAEADRLGLDWKLVVAISGTESYFGKHIPTNSYNAWGWAVYTGRNYGKNFDNWDHGISTVSEGLKENYVNQGLTTVEQIGRKYAADPKWASKVRHFMAQIESFNPEVTFDIHTDFPEQMDILASLL